MRVVRRGVLRFALNRLNTLADLAGALEAVCAAGATKVCDQLDLIPTGVHERATLAKEIR